MSTESGYPEYRPGIDKILYYGPISGVYDSHKFRELMESKFGAEEVGRSRLGENFDWTYDIRGMKFRLEHLANEGKAKLIMFRGKDGFFDEVRDMVESEIFRNPECQPVKTKFLAEYTEGVKTLVKD